MEDIKWPDWMPLPQVSGYGMTPIDRRIISETEVGSIVRKQFETDECECSCALVLDQLQANFFEAFERDILDQGTRWFTINLWTGGKVATHRVQFMERPTLVGVRGLHSEYSLKLRVEERKGMSGVAAWSLYMFGAEADWSFATRLHEILIRNRGLTALPEVI